MSIPFDYSKIYYKVIYDHRQTHTIHRFTNGMNYDMEATRGTGYVQTHPLGFSFTTRACLPYFTQFGGYVCKIKVPYGTDVFNETIKKEDGTYIYKWRANPFLVYFHKKVSISSFHWTRKDLKKEGKLLRYWKGKQTTNICIDTIQNNIDTFTYVKEKNIKICEVAFAINGLLLKEVSLELKTAKLCKIAVKQSGWAISFVPESLRTISLWKLALQQNGMVLQYLPKEQQTSLLCKYAVKQCGYALQFVLPTFRKMELYKLSVQHPTNTHGASFIEKEKWTLPLALIAVKANGFCLSDIPSPFQTKEVCEIAIKQYPILLYEIKNKIVFDQLSPCPSPFETTIFSFNVFHESETNVVN